MAQRKTIFKWLVVHRATHGGFLSSHITLHVNDSVCNLQNHEMVLWWNARENAMCEWWYGVDQLKCILDVVVQCHLRSGCCLKMCETLSAEVAGGALVPRPTEFSGWVRSCCNINKYEYKYIERHTTNVLFLLLNRCIYDFLSISKDRTKCSLGTSESP